MKQIFQLKSYFTFLGRNKAYTFINVSGLSAALTFVVLIGLYVWQSYGIDHQHAKAGRTVVMGFSKSDGGNGTGTHHVVQKHLRQRYPEIESTCGFCMSEQRLKKVGGYVRVKMLTTDDTFFNIFDFRLLQGDRNTCLKGKDNAVITEQLARELFGDADPMGQTIVWKDTLRLHVTGVVQDFDRTIINGADLLVNFYNERYNNYANNDENFPRAINYTGCSVFLLMRPGKTLIGREEELNKFIVSFWPTYNDVMWNNKALLVPFDRLYLSGYECANGSLCTGNPTLINILLAVAAVILLFSVTNYINLTVAQSGYRAREMATRRLFGARRAAIVGQLMVEGIVLSVVSLLLALVFAHLLAPYFGQLLDMQPDMHLMMSPATLLLLMLFALLLGALSGIVPAAVLSRSKPVEVVRGTFRRQTKMVFSRVFITLQNVITITMLACALTMVFQMRHLVNAPMGFRTDKLFVVNLFSVEDKAGVSTFANELRRLPGVKNVSASTGTPVDGGNNSTFFFGKQMVSFQVFIGDTAFFNVYDLHLADGSMPEAGCFYLNRRALSDIKYSTNSKTPHALLRDFQFYGIPGDAKYGGELKDFRIDNILREEHPMIVYVARQIDNVWSVTLQVEGNETEIYRRVAQVYKRVFREEMDSRRASFVDHEMQDKFISQIRTSRIVSLFAFIAMSISLLGLVAMSTYFTQQRQREIAVRKVFGSTSGQMRRRLVGTFMLYVAVAFVIAVPIVWHFMGGWISQYSYRIEFWPWILVAGLFCLLICLAAVSIQSYVASNENPVIHLKKE